jgi:iron complex outermembrane recepter protein
MFKLKSKTVRRHSTALAAVLLLMAAGAVSAHADVPVYMFNIPAENTAKALNDFARQSSVQIMFPYDLAAKHTAPAISGQFTRAEVLAKLLDGTGLEIAEETDTSITLRVSSPGGPKPSAEIDSGSSDVIVTGTHIRGGNPTSPVHTLTQKDIERSGYSQIGDLMRSLPENFAGGQNPGVLSANGSNGGNYNLSGASTINLRGLGTDATLVLVNGHRLSGDGDYGASDISGIPVRAIQRIDIIPDGASALYGSDAVAGVVNFVLRRSFSGLEARAVVGGASQGGGTQRQASLMGGFTSGRFYGVANVEIENQDAVEAKDRRRASGVSPEATLYPGLRRQSLFLSGGADLTDTMTLSVDALVNNRSMATVTQYTSASAQTQSTTNTPAFTVAINLDMRLVADWKLRLSNVLSGSRNSFTTYYPAFDFSSSGMYRNSTNSVEASADGTLFNLPSGPVKAAVGLGTRHQTFNYPVYVSRDVQYLYGEVQLPLVAPSTVRPGLHELDLNASVRTERYSRIGSATVPKIGLRYVPFDGVTVRASWGKSFKAPSFVQMFNTRYTYLINASDLGYAPTGTVLVTNGGNTQLKPEKSTSWTINAEFRPKAVPGLSVSATYFDIAYTDRIVTPTGILLNALATDQFAPYVEEAPSAATQTAVIAEGAHFVNWSSGSYDPGNVVAIFRDNYVNASGQTQKGMDLAFRQSFELPAGTISIFANGTFLQLKQQFIPTSPTVELSGRVFYVPKQKIRAGFNFESGRLSTTLTGNYVSPEQDTGVTPQRRIGSWTTADWVTTYRLGGTEDTGKDVRLSLAITNLFDRKPPLALSGTVGYSGIDYDSTNSSIMGRFASVSVSKAW